MAQEDTAITNEAEGVTDAEVDDKDDVTDSFADRDYTDKELLTAYGGEIQKKQPSKKKGAAKPKLAQKPVVKEKELTLDDLV